MCLSDALTGCGDDVTNGNATVVMTTAAVGVACFVGGALAGAALVGVICRPARYFLSRTTKTNVYGKTANSTGALALSLPLPSPDGCYSSMDAEDVFLTVSPQHGLTVSDACLQRQLMLKSTGSFRSMRTKLDSVDDDDTVVM